MATSISFKQNSALRKTNSYEMIRMSNNRVACDRRMPAKLNGMVYENSNEPSDAGRGRNVGYKEATRITD